MTLHSASIRVWRITTSGPYMDWRERHSGLLEDLLQLTKWLEQISVDVIVERFEGRNVKNPCVASGPFLSDQLIDCPQECRKCLAAPCWGADENMLAGSNPWPALLLPIRWLTDLIHKPLRNERVKERENVQRPTHLSSLLSFYQAYWPSYLS